MKSYFKFIHVYEDTYRGINNKVIMITSSNTTPSILEDFENFLKGCGYGLPDGARIGYEYEDEPRNFEDAAQCESDVAGRSLRESDSEDNDGSAQGIRD